MDELLERISSLELELESEKGKSSSMDDQVALMEKSYELAAKYMGGQNNGKPETVQSPEPSPVQKAGKSREEQGCTCQAGGASGGVLARTADE